MPTKPTKSIRPVPSLLALCAIAAGCYTVPEPAPAIEDRTASVELPPEPAIENRTAEIVPAQDLEQETALAITRDGAILTALANNRGLQIAEYGPRVSATFIEEERAPFDPDLLATASIGRDKNQLGGVQSFTFDTGGGDGGGLFSLLGIVGMTPQETLINIATTAFQRFQAAQVDRFLDAEEASADVTLMQSFPTGTSVFLTGSLVRSESNFTPEEFEGGVTVGVTQSLLRGFGRDVNLVSLRQAVNDRAQSEYVLNEAVLDLVETVELVYWDLALALEVVEIREFGVRLARGQLERNRDLLDAGRAVESAVLAAEAELATREADLHAARGDVRTLTIRLLRLMRPGEDIPWALRLEPADPPEVAPVDVSPRESEARAWTFRPEIYQNELALANRSIELVRARNRILPRLDFIAEYGRTSLGSTFGGGLVHLDDPEFDNWSVGLEFSLPIHNRAEKAQYRRARLEEAQAESTLADVRELVSEEVRAAAIAVETQWARIEATEKSVQSREEELRIEQDRYEVGIATNLDVLEVQRLLIQSQVDAATARVNYIQSLTNLYAAEGSLLQRRGVDFERRLTAGAIDKS